MPVGAESDHTSAIRKGDRLSRKENREKLKGKGN